MLPFHVFRYSYNEESGRYEEVQQESASTVSWLQRCGCGCGYVDVSESLCTDYYEVVVVGGGGGGGGLRFDWDIYSRWQCFSFSSLSFIMYLILTSLCISLYFYFYFCLCWRRVNWTEDHKKAANRQTARKRAHYLFISPHHTTPHALHKSIVFLFYFQRIN